MNFIRYKVCLAQKSLTFFLINIEQLINNKAEINAYNIHGNTALHYACHFGYSDLCFELIKFGASVNNCNRYDLTPTDLCRKALREMLLNLARSYNLLIAPVAFKEDTMLRLSRNKTSNLNFSTAKK